jgi:probable HAF family extracellular repeat protein
MSKAFAINDSGQVTGTSTVDSNVNYAFVTAPNSPINPATDRIDARRGISSANANGLFINNQGHVLGTVADYPTAFLHTQRSTTILPFIQYIWQDFAGLTEQDQVVYTSATGLAVWQNGKSTELIACPSPCVPTGVNSSLQIIGATIKNSFLYRDGVLYDLNTLLPTGSGWTMPDTSGGPSPLRINELGQIAGIAILNNETHAFRLDPVLSVTNAIEKALNMLSSMTPNLGRRNSGLLMMKSTLTSHLNDAIASWSRGNSSATRGLLNEFETLVRSQAGQSLTNDQANQLIQMAEAAFGLT